MSRFSSHLCDKKRSWLLTIIGLGGIGFLLALPFVKFTGEGDGMPQLMRFMGHFHPVLLHLPIGVFILIFFQELGMMLIGRKPQSDSGIGFPLMFGVISAVIAVLAGYLLFKSGAEDYAGNDLAQRHLWGGLVFACAVIVTALIKSWSLALGWRPAMYRWPLFLTIGIMSFASHDGASMTHGSDYLTQYAPGPLKSLLGGEVKMESGSELLVYEDVIEPIFERRCVQCHKDGKSKGQLRMDSFEWLVKGGKEGPAIEVGKADESNIVLRMALPLDDEEHMPPKGKPQVEQDELAVIKWWINSGADSTSKLSDVKLPGEIESIVASLIEMPGSALEDPQGHGKVAASEKSVDLLALVSGISKKFPGALTFESQQSAKVTLSAVAMRGKLGDEEFKSFVPVIPHLVTVDLSATAISDASVALLSGAVDLKMLRLSETRITDVSMETLGGLRSLESLNLYGTAITDRGLLKLAALSNLKRLYLWQTPVSEAGVEKLKVSLPSCEIILGSVPAVTK